MGSDHPRPDTDDWRGQAACLGLDTELFFPGRGEPTAPARAVCTTCPVQTECLVDALHQSEGGESYSLGIRGGTSNRDRRRIRRLAAGGPAIAPSEDPANRRATARGITDPDDPRHGTIAGYRAHHRAGQPACTPCREAENERRRNARTPRPRPPVHCGTHQGYARHRRLHEAPCPACREAARIYQRERRAQRRQETAAAQAALGPRRGIAS